MKHFSDARGEARRIITETDIRKRGDKWCLVWDLHGRLRILCWPASGYDTAELSAEIDSQMKQATGDFWTGETWFWNDKEKAENIVLDQAWKDSTGIPLDSGTPEVREINRRLSKGGWFGQPITPPWPLNDQTVPVISFFSFKGGVGRTTALASVAIQLARVGRRVCVVDLDLEAPGAGVAFPMAGEGPLFGVVDYLIERPLQARETIDLGDYAGVCDSPDIIGTAGAPITVIPCGRLDDDYLEKLARLDYEAFLLGRSTEEPPLIRLLEEVKSQFKVDYILLDSRAGLHDIGGLALNGIAHLDVVFALDNAQSWAGMSIVISHLGRLRVERDLPQQNCAFVYAMAPMATEEDRPTRVQAFTDAAHSLFSGEFYDAEPPEGWPDPIPEDVWPVPASDAQGEPHFPLVLGFRADIQQSRSLNAVAEILTQGDYGDFLTGILNRIGRTKP